MHGVKSEGVTHESMCHHHLIPHQFEWEKSSEDEIEKERKEGEGKRKGREGEREKGKNQQVLLRPTILRWTEFIGLRNKVRLHDDNYATTATRRCQRGGVPPKVKEVGFLLLRFISRLGAV